MANPGLDECTICFLIVSRCQDRRSPGDLVAHRKDVDSCTDYAHSPPNSSSQTWLLPPDVDAVVLHCIQRQQSRLQPRHAEAQDAPRQRLQQETQAAFHPFCRRLVSISQSSWTQPRSY